MGSRSKEERERWLQQQQRKPDDSAAKRAEWMETKRENERVHVHFMCTCLACAQEFAICGLPCFVICPNCHLTLRLQSA